MWGCSTGVWGWMQAERAPLLRNLFFQTDFLFTCRSAWRRELKPTRIFNGEEAQQLRLEADEHREHRAEGPIKSTTAAARQTVPQMWRLSERQLMGGTVGVLGGRGREGQADREEGSTKGCRWSLSPDLARAENQSLLQSRALSEKASSFNWKLMCQGETRQEGEEGNGSYSHNGGDDSDRLLLWPPSSCWLNTLAFCSAF